MVNDMAVIASAARMTGWKIARCMSFGQPRNWHQTVTMMPGQAGQPAQQAIQNSDADVAAGPAAAPA